MNEASYCAHYRILLEYSTDIETAPAVLKHPGARPKRSGLMDKSKSSAPDPHPSTEESPHACMDGLVFIGHLVEDESGEEVEVIESAPCRRCSDKA
jgi:hypothetical protein